MADTPEDWLAGDRVDIGNTTVLRDGSGAYRAFYADVSENQFIYVDVLIDVRRQSHLAQSPLGQYLASLQDPETEETRPVEVRSFLTLSNRWIPFLLPLPMNQMMNGWTNQLQGFLESLKAA